MEAKVDIRKLQLLNDRITQTIDALNQVRWSVHGLQHATGGFPNQGAYGAAQQPLPFYAQSPYNQSPYAQSAFGPGTVGQQIPFGVSQQTLSSQPWQQVPMGPSPYGTAGMPFNAAMNAGIQHSTQAPYGVSAFGVGHTPLDIERQLLEARAADPYLISRTFPQAFVPTMGW